MSLKYFSTDLCTFEIYGKIKIVKSLLKGFTHTKKGYYIITITYDVNCADLAVYIKDISVENNNFYIVKPLCDFDTFKGIIDSVEWDTSDEYPLCLRNLGPEWKNKITEEQFNW